MPRCVVVEPGAAGRLCRGLSRVMGNYHARFLGGDGAVMRCLYPAPIKLMRLRCKHRDRRSAVIGCSAVNGCKRETGRSVRARQRALSAERRHKVAGLKADVGATAQECLTPSRDYRAQPRSCAVALRSQGSQAHQSWRHRV